MNTIVSPIGGFGNHLRWLMLLDPQFNFGSVCSVPNWNYDMYSDIRGPSWPNFQENFSDMPSHIKKECVELLPERELLMVDIKNNTVDEKVKFILLNVYCNDRTWHNWLKYEFKFRYWLDNFILFTHDLCDIQPTDNNILTTISEYNTYKHYLKFNSLSSGDGKDGRIRSTKAHNTEVNAYKYVCTRVDTDILFNSDLNMELYCACINAFGLDNNYTYANTVHNKWFNLQKKSEIEFVNNITEIYKT
jgi:hypothetical protein